MSYRSHLAKLTNTLTNNKCFNLTKFQINKISAIVNNYFFGPFVCFVSSLLRLFVSAVAAWCVHLLNWNRIGRLGILTNLGVQCHDIEEPPYYRCGACKVGLTGNGTHCTDLDEVSSCDMWQALAFVSWTLWSCLACLNWWPAIFHSVTWLNLVTRGHVVSTLCLDSVAVLVHLVSQVWDMREMAWRVKLWAIAN